MNYYPSPNPKLQFLGDDGKPLVNGILKTFIAGSSIPVPTFNDSGTKNPAVIRLDSRGECSVRLKPDMAYKFVLCRADGSIVWEADTIKASNGDGGFSNATILAGEGIRIDSVFDEKNKYTTYTISRDDDMAEELEQVKEGLSQANDNIARIDGALTTESSERASADETLQAGINAASTKAENKTAVSYGGAVIKDVSVANTDSSVSMTSTDGFNVEMPTKAALNAYAKTTEVEAKIKSALSSVMDYKGTASVATLNALTEIKKGDSYNMADSGTLTKGNVVVSAGDNVAWDGSKWDSIGQSVDLSGYLQKTTAASTYKTLETTDTMTEEIMDDTEFYSTAKGGYGANTKKWFRAKALKIWNYVKGKADGIYASKTEVTTELGKKADKSALSDYATKTETNTMKNKLDGISTGANKLTITVSGTKATFTIS